MPEVWFDARVDVGRAGSCRFEGGWLLDELEELPGGEWRGSGRAAKGEGGGCGNQNSSVHKRSFTTPPHPASSPRSG